MASFAHLFPSSSNGSVFTVQRAALLLMAVAAVAGGLTAIQFLQGNLFPAWMLFQFGFVSLLLVGMGLTLYLAYHLRIERGEYRAATHLSFSVIFPTITVFFAIVALLTAPIRLSPVEAWEGVTMMSRPDFLQTLPTFYAMGLLISVFSGPVYAMMTKVRRDAPMTVYYTDEEGFIVDPDDDEPPPTDDAAR
ncbi:MAG: hypothetical protein NZ518_07880 [Dehalococcoidia bacterium]|nr:hypothetical protein [Dehalococcoidia bacterium]